MTTPQPLAELAARYFADVTLKCWARDKDSNDKWDLLHSPLFIRQDVEYYVGHEPPPPIKRTINVPAATIDNLRAQFAEAQGDAERWDRAAHCVRLDQFGGFVVTPDEPALDSDISLAFTREIDASIDAARGEKNGA